MHIERADNIQMYPQLLASLTVARFANIRTAVILNHSADYQRTSVLYINSIIPVETVLDLVFFIAIRMFFPPSNHVHI